VSAEQDLERLEPEIAERVVRKVDEAIAFPFHFLEMLKGYPYYKLRIGNYRAVIAVYREEEVLEVILVDHRDKVYQKLDRRS
jgi:mRNA interferase RelE/StbE